MKQVEIFGKGCPNCERLAQNVMEASIQSGIKVNIDKITDVEQFAEHGVLKTPGLAIDGKLVSQGRVLPIGKIIELLQ
ncbi:MAG: TM0996/MTH895 family glutaredoxin-like protein [Candidatus Heimdallarchaeota archaeon]|nr:TM0996/MTH895 family glutaredoxin-like protein [Candidatus Heimdallarchaeota archaeon]